MTDNTWVRVRFQDLIDEGVLEIGDGHRAKLSELTGGGPIFLRAVHLTESRIDLEGVERFSPELAGHLKAKMAKAGDTIVTTKGNSTGRTGFVADGMPEFVYSPHLSFWRSRDPGRLAAGFLRYWARSPEFRDQLTGMKHSTDMAPYLSLRDQRRLLVSLPPPLEQHAIASILGALDAKLDLNGSTNRTIEAILRAVFKSWFVDFDPVLAKAVGREPVGLDPQGAAEFPTNFSEAAPDTIPDGWRLAPIYDVADVVYGAPFASHHFNAERRGLPLLRIRDLVNQNPEVFTDEVHPKGKTVKQGDIVVGMDGEFRAVIWHGPESWLNQRVCQFTPKGSAGTSYIYHSIIEPLAEFERTKVGTTVTHLGKADIDTFRVVHPGDRILARFTALTQPLIDRTLANAAESRLVSQLRDYLLPRLLSGEVRVDQARSLVEQVV